ncbi:cytochrome P450, partial [Mycena rebaudengoi]
MTVASTVALAIGAALLIRYLTCRRSSIANVPGPAAASWKYGSLLELHFSPHYGSHEFQWQKQYGPVYRVKGCFGDNLVVSDPLCLQRIFVGSSFKRAPVQQKLSDLVNGEGSVMSLHGNDHRRARAALGPAFSAGAMRKLIPMFKEIASTARAYIIPLTSRLEAELEKGSTIDICRPLYTTTLAAISEAAFGCSLEDLGEDLVENYRVVLEMSSKQSADQLLATPILPYIPQFLLRASLRLPNPASRALFKSKMLSHELGARLVNEKLEALEKGLELPDDVYSFLLKPEGPDKKQAMTGTEVAAQTTLLLLAGQDSTSNTLAFAIRELGKAPEFQGKLRAEINANLGSKAYDSLPLLNAFIKESLRLHPILPITERIAVEDTFLPLSYGITTTTGERLTKLPIQKGQLVKVAIAAYQRLEAVWGPDADEFKPMRWIDGPAYKEEAVHVGPYSNLMNFIAGPGTCLG